MFALIVKRILWMIPTLFLVSVISFIIIQLPPGDYLTSYITALEESGDSTSATKAEGLRKQYDLDQPMVKQYAYWMFGKKGPDGQWVRKGVIRGDLGKSFEWNKPVRKLIGERMVLTITLALCTLLITWAIAVPIGIYSAVKQYSVGDYVFTTLGFLGIATPNFLLALIVMYVGYAVFGVSPGGLFSAEFQSAPWSWARFLDLLQHLWVPVVIIGIGNTAGMMRILRGNLLDELRKQYVLTARAKGLPRLRLLLKYPVRVAINPLVSTVGWVLPAIISGSAITEMVLGLPSTGPLLLQALQNQDMYLAGSMIMLMSLLTVTGTLISDLLLLWLDPRIRMDGQSGE